MNDEVLDVMIQVGDVVENACHGVTSQGTRGAQMQGSDFYATTVSPRYRALGDL
jgi:hypothetical protein